MSDGLSLRGLKMSKKPRDRRNKDEFDYENLDEVERELMRIYRLKKADLERELAKLPPLEKPKVKQTFNGWSRIQDKARKSEEALKPKEKTDAEIEAEFEMRVRESEKRKQKVRNAINIYLKSCGVPAIYQWATFDRLKDLPQSVFEMAKEWGHAYGAPVLLYGPAGSGKTCTAVAMLAQILIEDEFEPKDCMFLEEIDYLDQIQESFNTPEVRRSKKPFEVPVLVYDDFGSNRSTDWMLREAFKLIHKRYVNAKTTIITTNLSIEKIEELDTHMASRLIDARMLIEFPKRDLRGTGTIFMGWLRKEVNDIWERIRQREKKEQNK